MIKILVGIVLLLFGIAYFTKPDDKTCIIEGVKAVWGKLVPHEKEMPEYFEQFMDLSHTNVEVKDRLFFKQVKYNVPGKQKTVAIGAFSNVFATVKPFETDDYVPPIPVPPKQ